MRFSSPEQAKGDSKRRQTQQAEEYAATNGLELDDKLTYRDYGVSAFRGANVEIGKLGQFMEAIRRKEVEYGSFLLVESLDRITREHILPAQNIFTQIILEGITIITLTDKRVYSAELVNNTPFLLIEAIVILIRANEESETKSKRLKAAWENRRNNVATKKLVTSGPAWLKFNENTNSFEVIPDRGDVVRRIYKEYLENKGLTAIARDLRDENIATWSRKKSHASIWREPYVWKILNSAAVIGTLIPHKMDPRDGKTRIPLAEVKNYYPPVISEETFNRVRHFRLNFKRAGISSANLRNIFSMLGRCAQCGARKMLSSRSGTHCYLACVNQYYGQGCKCKPIPYPRLETAFLTEFVKALSILPPSNPEVRQVHVKFAEIRDNIKDSKFEQIKLLDYAWFENESDRNKANREICDGFLRLDQTIAQCQQDLQKLLADPKNIIQQQMVYLTQEIVATACSTPLNKPKFNAILNSMCDNIVISLGRIEIKFKVGPKLLIEYDRDYSHFTFY